MSDGDVFLKSRLEDQTLLTCVCTLFALVACADACASACVCVCALKTAICIVLTGHVQILFGSRMCLPNREPSQRTNEGAFLS